MNFWQGYYSNNFDEIFDNNDLTLEEVLENQHIIMEFRNKNPKLINL